MTTPGEILYLRSQWQVWILKRELERESQNLRERLWINYIELIKDYEKVKQKI